MKTDIYQYSQTVPFLQDYYKTHKASSSQSLRDWASQMGFENPVVLLDILNKKRAIKLKYVEFFLKGLELTSKEKNYFETMVRMENAPKEDQEYFQNILIDPMSEDA